MKIEKLIITVKNMVCDYCIKVVIDELSKNNIVFNCVKLGEIHFNHVLSISEKEILKPLLEKEGFKIIETLDTRIVNQIKVLISENIHYKKHRFLNQNFSAILATNQGVEYTQLSRIFSEQEGRTIERYIIQQKIERVKELIDYNEPTLSQISYELSYSSPQHISRQFKQITEITPSEY